MIVGCDDGQDDGLREGEQPHRPDKERRHTHEQPGHPAEVSQPPGSRKHAGKRARLDLDDIAVRDIAVRARVVPAVSMTAKSTPDHDPVYLLNNRRLRKRAFTMTTSHREADRDCRGAIRPTRLVLQGSLASRK